MRITPTQTSFAPDGPPPSFRVETGGSRFYAVQVTSDALLFNGANASRRTQANFFDSWFGDDRIAPRPGGSAQRVAGRHLEAPTGRATYKLPQAVWERMRGQLRQGGKFYYRLLVSRDERFRQPSASVIDANASRAPSVSIARLPAQPVRHPVAGFTGGSRGHRPLSLPNFLDLAQQQMAVDQRGIIQGRDGDFRFVILDARYFHMTVLECQLLEGLTKTVEKMPRKPDAVINGQFYDYRTEEISTEGQVIREGELINANSRPTRYYVAQNWRGSDVGDYYIGNGDPKDEEPDARVAFGGLGPVLLHGAPAPLVHDFERGIYNEPAKTGRGVIAIHRSRELILLLVQENSFFPFSANNPMVMADVRQLLQRMGFDDAIFNDGSDSESLYAYNGWLLRPASRKDGTMDFAISLGDTVPKRGIRMLSLDGTTTRDAEKFINGIGRPLITHYAPHNISDDLESLPALSSIASTFQAGIIQSWQATTQNQADVVERIIELAGFGGHWADLLYVSSHAWRHGQLYYHLGGGDTGPILVMADLWSPGFRPVWRTTPRWLIIAGCAVLGLRYSRGLRLDATERNHLTTWHQEMHGSGATVPGLTSAKQAVFEVFHPGWAWYDRVFRNSPGLRGVLGYWYRSPGRGADEEIIEEFSEKLRKGESLLEAWEEANQRGVLENAALWAAMVRDGCQADTLATLEDPNPAPGGEWKYYDRSQDGRLISNAYRQANLLNDSTEIGSVTVQHNKDYDHWITISINRSLERGAIAELKDLGITLTPANLLLYNDGIGPR